MGKTYKNYHTTIFAYCVSKVHHKELAEDLSAETFYKYYKIRDKREKSLPEEAVKPYLFTIARNLINDHFRKKNLHKDYLLQRKEEQAEVNPEKSIFSSLSLEEKIFKAVQNGKIQLTPTELIVFEAIFIKHVCITSNKEISKITGLGIKKVESAKKTMRRRIFKHFKKEK